MWNPAEVLTLRLSKNHIYLQYLKPYIGNYAVDECGGILAEILPICASGTRLSCVALPRSSG
jgi:hypothetical protein